MHFHCQNMAGLCVQQQQQQQQQFICTVLNKKKLQIELNEYISDSASVSV